MALNINRLYIALWERKEIIIEKEYSKELSEILDISKYFIMII